MLERTTFLNTLNTASLHWLPVLYYTTPTMLATVCTTLSYILLLSNWVRPEIHLYSQRRNCQIQVSRPRTASFVLKNNRRLDKFLSWIQLLL